MKSFLLRVDATSRSQFDGRVGLVEKIMFCIQRYKAGRSRPFKWTYSGKVFAA